tara:strand:- start:69 stop:605 length:537 start_codon:yes stop_codon:yes gene_type:complete
MKIVKIDTEDNICNIELEYNNNIINSLNSIDNNNLELLYEWNFESNIVECYGCIDSDCNIKNKHILPSFGISSSNIICDKSEECNIYGNIYILCKNKDYFDYDYGMLYFNINDNNNYDDENNDDENDDENDDDENDNDENDNDENEYVNNYNTELFKSKYLVENKIENDLLDYDNNIY